MRTLPVNQSPGPLTEAVLPALVIFMLASAFQVAWALYGVTRSMD
jgi:hypothetical protein